MSDDILGNNEYGQNNFEFVQLNKQVETLL